MFPVVEWSVVGSSLHIKVMIFLVRKSGKLFKSTVARLLWILTSLCTQNLADFLYFCSISVLSGAFKSRNGAKNKFFRG